METVKCLDLLNDEDKRTYATLCELFSGPTTRNRRNKSIEIFEDALRMIRKFVIRGDEDDWKRSYVCGLCWLGDTVAINTRQLRRLVAKSKSSINGLFQSMGYGMVAPGSDSGAALSQFIAPLRENFAEIRQWTLRAKIPGVTKHHDIGLIPSEMPVLPPFVPDYMTQAKVVTAPEPLVNFAVPAFLEPAPHAFQGLDIFTGDDKIEPAQDFMTPPPDLDAANVFGVPYGGFDDEKGPGVSLGDASWLQSDMGFDGSW